MKNVITKTSIAFLLLCITTIVRSQCVTITITPVSSSVACNQVPVTFTANTTPSTNVTYQWLQPGGNTPLNSQYCTPSSVGVYTFIATNTASNCVVTKTVQVNGVDCTPFLTITGANPNKFDITCVNCVTMTTMASFGSTCSNPPVGMFWTDAAGTTTLTNSNTYSTCIPGNYRVYCVNLANPTCTVAQLVSVSMNTITIINFTSNPPVICVGQTATITAGGALTYTWNPGNIISNSIVITPTATTIYSCAATGTNGCTNSTVHTITLSTCANVNQISNSNAEVSLFPNPNNGHFNLVLNKSIDKAELQIMNSLGQVVYIGIVSQGNNVIDVGQLAKGIYQCVLLANNQATNKVTFVIK